VKHPLLYQINTRVALQERSQELRRPATLDDVTDAFLDDVAAKGFEWIWYLGVWQTGPEARAISRSDAGVREASRRTLPDLREEDICGSPFSIRAYEVNADFGGDAALVHLRERLGRRKLKLLLDFVPDHTAPDHPWVDQHPEYYVAGTEDDLARQPQNYVRRIGPRGREMILAHGRDPYFDGWRDTLQLNYRHAGFREAQLGQLAAIARRCDGVRCDMAMLLQPEIFRRTWGDRSLPSDGSPPRDVPFWPEAIAAARRVNPQLVFIAEVYWDMEWELQQAGFDYTYDKRLYDRLRAGAAVPVRQHLMAQPSFQDHSVRFLENHDETRAAETFPGPMHRAAALLTFLPHGLRFFHEGQLEGRRAQVSMHLGRRPVEAVDPELRAFYGRLLECLARPEVHEGQWRLLECRQAWPGNPTHDQFIAQLIAPSSPAASPRDERRLLCVVNYGGFQGQCYVTLDVPDLAGRTFTLVDLVGSTQYQRQGDELANKGLYLDMPAWGHHLFELRPLPP
jgi:Alpha amylase, catalytic domain